MTESKKSEQILIEKIKRKSNLLLSLVHLRTPMVEEREGFAEEKRRSKLYCFIQPYLGRLRTMRKRDKVIGAMATIFLFKKSQRHRKNKKAGR